MTTPAVSIEKLTSDVRTLRTRIEVLKSERAAFAAAPTARRTAIARVDSHIAYLAGEARVSIGAFVSRERSAAPELIHRANVGLEGGGGTVGFESVARFLAWTNADAIRAALIREVDAYYAAHGEGIDDEALAERIAAIDAELLEFETEEERTIMALEAVGVRNLQRRPDADPRALVAACTERV
jgi:hypothetical protein